MITGHLYSWYVTKHTAIICSIFIQILITFWGNIFAKYLCSSEACKCVIPIIRECVGMASTGSCHNESYYDVMNVIMI